MLVYSDDDSGVALMMIALAVDVDFFFLNDGTRSKSKFEQFRFRM